MSAPPLDGWLAEPPVQSDANGPMDVPFEPFDARWMQATPIERFDYMAERYADRIAVDDGVTRLTYAQVARKARALAQRIDAEAPPGPLVGVFRYTALVPIVMMAALATGRTLIPVDALHPQDRQQAILRNAGAAALLLQTGVEIDTVLPDLPRLEIDLDALDDGEWPVGTLNMQGVAGIIYTSGSTGNPKGLAWGLAGFTPYIGTRTNTLHLNPDDRIIALGSLSSAGLGDAVFALMNGATLRVVEIMQAGVGELLRIMGEEKVTILSFVPTILRSILQMDDAPAAFRHLRILELYGDATLANDVAFFRTKLPADCHIRLVLGTMESGEIFSWFVPKDWNEAAMTLPCGYVTPGRSVAVLDDEGRPTPVGEIGNVVIRSRQMALGAWQDGRLTPGPFLTAPDDPESRVYTPGDQVRIRHDGLAEFIGRVDRQVKVRGMRADLGEVEAALRQHPDVADVAVVAVAHPDDTEIVAYITVHRPGTPPSASDLRATVVAETAEHMAPSRIFALDAIPRLPNYKPDLVRLSQQAQRDLDRGVIPTRPVSQDLEPEIVSAVEQAWAATLRDRAEPGLSWESSGGDSLEELQLIHRIEVALGYELNVPIEGDFTVIDLARAVGDAITAGAKPLSPDDRVAFQDLEI